MKPILFTDYDFTLDPHASQNAFEHNLQAVQDFRRRGGLVVIITGRTLASLKRIFSSYADYCDYVIVDNGAICYTSHRELLFHFLIDSALIIEINQFITAKLGLGDYQNLYSYGDQESLQALPQTSKIRTWVKNNAMATALCESLKQHFPTRIKAYPSYDDDSSRCGGGLDPGYMAFVDTKSILAGKENAIESLLTTVKPTHVFAIGDSENDYAMLRKYHGYAIRGSSAAEVASPDHIVADVAELLNALPV